MTMLILSFYLISSFLLNLSSSVSIMIEKKCLTDDDCDLELICNKETNICTCPKPYFWRDDLRACFGCAPGWLELETKKCLLFAISHSSGVTWYQAETICNTLIAQPMTINHNFKALQHQIDYLLNGINALTATLYFHQGAWVDIDDEWIESYTWCNNNEKRDFFDCVQIRQNSTTNTICLQYVSCNEHSHFICEASPVIRSELEKNIAKTKHSVINDRNEEIIVRLPRLVTAKPVVALTPAKRPPNQMMVTTKKPSSFSFNSFSNILQSGFAAVGQISNAVGSYYGSKNQNQQSQNSYDNQQMPQALEGESNQSNLLLFGVVGVGVFIFIIIIIIIIVVVCLKKKRSSHSKSSIRSTESDTSVVSTE